jgi:ribosome-associated protein
MAKTSAAKSPTGKISGGKTAASKAPVAKLPRKKTAPAVIVSPPVDESPMLSLVMRRLDDMKAENVVVIDTRGKSLFSDHMVVASGRSNRHVAACAEAVAKALKEAGAKKIHVEGLSTADWVLVDTGEVIVHLFRPEVREFYNIERLWSQSPDALARPA